jgi:hypothetical protein
MIFKVADIVNVKFLSRFYVKGKELNFEAESLRQERSTNARL